MMQEIAGVHLFWSTLRVEVLRSTHTVWKEINSMITAGESSSQLVYDGLTTMIQEAQGHDIKHFGVKLS